MARIFLESPNLQGTATGRKRRELGAETFAYLSVFFFFFHVWMCYAYFFLPTLQFFWKPTLGNITEKILFILSTTCASSFLSKDIFFINAKQRRKKKTIIPFSGL